MSRSEAADPGLVTIADLDTARRYVDRALGEVLAIEQAADNCRFEELGGTSVLAVVLIGRLWEETGIRLQVTTLTSRTTVRQLATSLLEAGRALREP